MGQWLLHGGSGYSSGGCSITVPRSFSPHGKVLHGPHTDARGLVGFGSAPCPVGASLVEVHGQQPAPFPLEAVGYNCADPSLERGQVPRVGTSFACGRNSPQCKLVRAPSDPCGHLLFRLGVHSLPPMERVGSVRASATVKGPPLAAQKRRRVQQHGFRPP